MDEFGIARLFHQNNFGDFSREQIKTCLVGTTRLLFSDQAVALFDTIIRGNKLTKVEQAEGHYHWLVGFDPEQDQSLATKRETRDKLLFHLADHVKFEFVDMAEGENGSSVPCETSKGITPEDSQTNYMPHTMFSTTLMHEITHASRFVFRSVDLTGETEEHYTFGCCESDEEGFEMEKAIWGGRLSPFIYEYTAADDEECVEPVPTVVEWPDPNIVRLYDTPGYPPIRTRSKLDGCTSRMSFLPLWYMRCLFEEPVGSPLRLPESPGWKSPAEYESWVRDIVDSYEGKEQLVDDATDSEDDDEDEDEEVSAVAPTLTRVDSGLDVDDQTTASKDCNGRG